MRQIFMPIFECSFFQWDVRWEGSFSSAWESPPNFLDYQIQEPFGHIAKFRGDRPTELGYLVAKPKKRRKKH